MAKILVISDQPVLNCGFEHVLMTRGLGTIMAPTVAHCSDALAGQQPDLILLDITAGLNFGDLTELHNHVPQCPIVLWTDAIPLDMVFRTLEFGVRGMVPRRAGPEQLLDALTRVASGEMQIGFGATQDTTSRRRVSLTPREKEIVKWLRQGLRNKEIAAEMHITEGTVKIYLFRLFQKVGVRNRFELASCQIADCVPSPSRAHYLSDPAAGLRPTAGVH